MTSHDACTSGTSRVLTVVSLQRLKRRLLFQLPPTVKCVCDKILECTEHSVDRNPSQLVFGEFWVQIPVLTKRIGVLFVVSLSLQGKCCVGFTLPRSIYPLAGRIHKIYKSQILRQWECQRGGDECHYGSNSMRQTSTTQDTKLGPTVWHTVCLSSGGEYVEK